MTHTTANNIIAFKGGSAKVTRAHLQNLPTPIKTLREQTKKSLTVLLDRFFKDTDDQLFALAKNAVTQTDQDDFFTTMRSLRSQQSNIIQRFFELQDCIYAQLNIPTNDGKAHTLDHIKASELSLVGYDDLDELVAAEALVTRAATENENLISEVTGRVDAIVIADLSAQSLPTAPKPLTDCFVEAIHLVEINNKPMMVLFKVYEKLVLRRLADLYRLQNQLLAKYGIEPHVHPAKAEINATDEFSHVEGMDLSMDPEYDPAMLAADVTQQKIRRATPHHNAVRAPTGAPELLNALAELRTLSASGQLDADSELDPLRAKIRSAEAQLHQQFQLSREETEFVDLVDRLFHSLGDTLHLTPPVQSLLSQMQIPLATMAYSDRRFLNDPSHGARNLLNALTEAVFACEGQTREQLSRDPLVKKIDQLIKSLAKVNAPTERDFKLALLELENFRQVEDQRTKILEKRLHSAELGRLKSQQAQRLVESTIAAAVKDTNLADAVYNVIDRGWQQVLLYNALNHGPRSPAWEEAVRTLLDVVAISQNPPAMDSNAILETKINLMNGFESINFNAFVMDELLTEFEAALIDAAAASTRHSNRPEPNKSCSVEELICAVEEGLQPSRTEPHEGSALQAYRKQAKGLSRGGWFDLKINDEVKRCRLAAIIEDYDNYIFVNRQGKKLLDMDINQVAQRLQSGDLEPLDSNQLFEKSLAQVIGGIRNKKSDPTAS